MHLKLIIHKALWDKQNEENGRIMNMKTMVRKKVILLLMCTCMLTACHITTRTEMENCQTNTDINLEFTYQTDVITESYYDETTIYIDETRDKMRLYASLTKKGGEVSVQIVAAEDGTVIWDGIYNKNCDFNIDLQDVEADSEYIVKVEAKDNRKLKLTISSDDKWVKRK